jgi:hypothetical protein
VVPIRAEFGCCRKVVRSILRDWGIFTLVQVIVCLWVYGSALWGARFLAPLDIAPAIFPAYRFVDPASDGIPDNHYIIDQLTYDLPLQTVIYDAYRRGEMPWWDPYTYGGRPLLADAHINGTDPIRILCYLTLPFKLAYNWNLILHSLVAAIGMFVLLRFWRFGLFTCSTLAVAWQFSGAFVMHFGHPWIGGAFVWFPFLWVCWEQALVSKSSSLRQAAIAAIFCSASFYSGNLQSHLYLPVFALVFLIGHWSTDWRATVRTGATLAVSATLGAALAAPVLANQIEFFLLSTREVGASLRWWEYPVRGLLSLGSIFPWATGTFRTLDIGKVVRSSGTAWLLFCGSATLVLAIVGLAGRRTMSNNRRFLWRTSAGLIATCLVIIGTPLAQIFYPRIAPLGVLGIIPLAAIGLHRLICAAWLPRPKVAIATAIGFVGLVAAVNAGAFFVYPYVKNQLTQAALAADSGSKTFPAGATALRSFQVDTFPSEVSLLNPETFSSLIGLLALSASLGTTSARSRRNLAYLSVIASLVPLISFAGRFIPSHPTELLKRLQAGGYAQRAAIKLVQGNNARILDRDMQVFPYAMAALYRVHTVHGYSALQPPGIFKRPNDNTLPAQFGADFDLRLSGVGEVIVERISEHPPEARLSALNGATIGIAEETLNQITLTYAEGVPNAIFRSDTHYPGWRLDSDGVFSVTSSSLGSIIRPIQGEFPESVRLFYRPSFLTPACILAALAFAFIILLLLISCRYSSSIAGDHSK